MNLSCPLGAITCSQVTSLGHCSNPAGLGEILELTWSKCKHLSAILRKATTPCCIFKNIFSWIFDSNQEYPEQTPDSLITEDCKEACMEVSQPLPGCLLKAAKALLEIPLRAGPVTRSWSQASAHWTLESGRGRPQVGRAGTPSSKPDSCRGSSSSEVQPQKQGF